MTEEQRRLYTYFTREGFLPIDRGSFPEFRAFDGGNIRLGEMTATVAAVWASAYSALYKSIKGCLCSVWFFQGEPPVYFEVNCPENSPQEAVDILYDLSVKAGLPFLQIYGIDENCLDAYQNIKGYDVRTEYNEDHSEYAYWIQDLLDLSGKANYYKRKRLKKCFDMPNLSVRPMKDAALCLKIQEEWCKEQDCAFCRSFVGCEKEALQVMIDIFDGTYTGLFLYIDEKPVGYTICQKMGKEVAFLYFGKAVIPDGFLYLIYTMFKDNLTGVEYMNINEDMGNMGLRQFKTHLSAHKKWRKYLCTYTKRSGL
jgi:hypothetical protein